ncbi:MAG: hypothetical protein QXE61_07900 [Nitrososphaerota archaeon]
MLAVFLVSTLYTVFNPVIIVGVAIIVIAILGLIARWRSEK